MMKLLKFLKGISILSQAFWVSFSLLAAPALAGVGSTGGGQVVKIDGHLHFLDRVSDSDIQKAEPLTEADENNDLNFTTRGVLSFDLSKRILKLSLQLEKKLVEIPAPSQFDLSTLMMALSLTTTAETHTYFTNSAATLAGISPSQRTSSKNQLVVGWFDGKSLFIQPYLFFQLSEDDQEAFLLHEAFRFYNQSDLAFHPSSNSAPCFSTSQIEELVRELKSKM